MLPHSRRVFDAVADLGVPRIHFGVGTGELLGLMAAAGADVVGVDWRVPLDVARTPGAGPTGPCRATSTRRCAWPRGRSSTEAVRDVLARNAGHPGHIFNLGHGVLPETDPSVLERVVELVHAEGRCDGDRSAAPMTRPPTSRRPAASS